MSNPNPRQSISEILVKWDMPTRQSVINELVQLIEATALEVIGTPGKGHIPDELCCDFCDLRNEQHTRLAQLLGREKDKS